MTAPRVLIAGFYHETNTFVDAPTTEDDFDWQEGAEMLQARNDGSPLAGILDQADRFGWEIVTGIDARAMPSGVVEQAVYQRFWSQLRACTQQALLTGLDGIVLVLHGAMVVEGIPDPEGTLLSALRKLPGVGSLPIVGVLDLHANVSQLMTDLATGWVAYRENPHIDGFESGQRAAAMLNTLLQTGKQAHSVYLHSRILVPPPGTATGSSPFRQLEAMARQLEAKNPEFLVVNVVPGFAHADVPEAGTTFNIVTTGDIKEATQGLSMLHIALKQNRELAFPREWNLEEAIEAARVGDTPALIVEPADNIGGGAPGDGSAVLRGLLKAQVPNSAIAINDPAAAATLHRHAPGSHLKLELGGRGSRLDAGPVPVEAELISLSDGQFRLEDPQSHLASMSGQQVRMGRCAVIRAGDLTILVTSRKTPPFDLGMWRSQGCPPEKFSLVGIKAAVAHRRAWAPITKRSFTVDVPGPCSSNLKTLPYRYVQRPIYPLD